MGSGHCGDPFVSTIPADHRFRYYDFVMAAFVAVLLCSMIIGPAKVTEFGGFQFGAGVLFFPISYILGDVLTEVYGYSRARKVVWTGFAALAYASLMASIIVHLPPADGWPYQDAYAAVLGQTPRIVIASLIAFSAGELVNAYVMAKMKIWTKGRHLWSRTIGSTVVGQGVDSLIFYPLAFIGVWPISMVIKVMVANYLIKVAWEAALTPVTYKVVGWLKRREGVEVFDTDTDFNPFKIKTS